MLTERVPSCNRLLIFVSQNASEITFHRRREEKNGEKKCGSGWGRVKGVVSFPGFQRTEPFFYVAMPPPPPPLTCSSTTSAVLTSMHKFCFEVHYEFVRQRVIDFMLSGNRLMKI